MKAGKFIRRDRQKKFFNSLYLFFLHILIGMLLLGSFERAVAADLAITSAQPPAATAGAAYSFTFTANGGTPPYTWDASLVSPDNTGTTWWFSSWGGAINGMTFNSTSGTLSGVPVFAGALPLRVKVTDADYRYLTLVYDFMVNGSGSPRLITNTPPSGIEGSAYSFRFATSWTSQLGCDPGIYFIDGSLPPGLSLNLISGDIGQPPNAYGTPMAAGVYTFTVSAATNIFCVNEPTETNAYTFTISILPTSPSSTPAGAANWSRYAGNPVLRVATSGWDNGQIASPSVLKVGSNYMMYYEGQDTATHTWQIGLTTSSDGVTWSKSASNPVLPKGSSGAWDAFEVRYPSVHYDGSVYRMWYWGRGSIDDIAKIGFATSSDGVNWTKHPTPVVGADFGGNGFIPGSVIKSGNSFIMWFGTQYGDIQRTTSSDGITWNTPQTVISGFSLKRPVVILDNGVYRAWFGKWDTGDNGGFAGTTSGETRMNIGYASSPDGITWTPYQQSTPLCTFCISTDSIIASLPQGVLGAWDRPGVGQPWVIKDGDQYKMWYTGGRIHRPYTSSLNNASYVEGAIGFATSGGSNVFFDVPSDHWAENYINSIYYAEITGGCGAGISGIYCPGNNVTREQMAAFIVRAVEGGQFYEGPCAGPSPFSDVPATSPFCRNIERLVARGITAGCGQNAYCPSGNVTREQMAAFMVRAVEGGQLYEGACAGGSPFTDVPQSSPFCRNIERLVNRGITQGCDVGVYCPSNNVLRDQMAAFLARAFLGML